MERAELEKIIREKLKEIMENSSEQSVSEKKDNSFMVEASGRHVHLSKKHLEFLFGKGYELTKVKDLSQPNQYAAKERVRVIGPRGEFSNVVILGPCRDFTQVELSLTDCRDIGVKGVIRESGDIKGTPGILIGVGDKYLQLDEGVIVAKRHIHMSVADAENFGVSNGQIVKVKTNGERSLIFDEVVIRVSDSYALDMHIDVEEGNAAGLQQGDW